MSGLRSHNEFDSLETFFNTRLKDASLEPTDNSWMLIEEELNKLAKEKRRRRFFWFFSSGVVLICGLVSLFYLLNGSQWTLAGGSKQLAVSSEQPRKVVSQKSEGNTVSSEQLAVSSEQSETNTEQPNTKQETAASSEKPVKIKNEKVENNITQKIQLGAFKHKPNAAAFNKIPYKVIEVNGNDGYTKYYAESNEKDALEKVQEAGFTGAFLKKDFDESLENRVVKSEGVVETAPVYIAANAGTRDEGRRTGGKDEVVKLQGNIVAAGNVKNNERQGTREEKKDPITETKDNLKENTNPAVVAAAQPAKENPAKENSVPSTETKSENTTPITVTSTEQPNTKHETAATNTEQETVATNPKSETTKQETAVAEIKKDSTPQVKEEKKDSVQTPVKTAATDSGKKSIFTPQWSIALLGGPNFFSSNSQSTTVRTLNEHQQLTYNGEIKMQYRPIKFLSVSGGINFMTFTAQQDATYFRFNKYQTADYQFHSSFGDMAVPMSDMLQGFWFNAPLDTFFADYSYTTTVQTINIPLQANVHFLNSKWVNLSLGIGANSSYAIGQHTHLSLIKENSRQEYNYNNVTAGKFNLLLMASLGCDIRITKHWYVTINPSYRYGVTNFSSISGTTYKPAFFSANAGVKFLF